MPATMERTISVDRLLAQRADAKLNQYGWSFENAVARMLVAIVTVQGEPEKAFSAPTPVPARRRPGGLRGCVRIASDFDDASDEMADLFEHSSVQG